MESLPFYIESVFMLTLAAAVYLFYRAANKSRTVLIILGAWMILQGILAGTGFYTTNNTIPPRFALAIGPPLLAIVYLMTTKRGRRFVDSLNAKTLMLIHIVRVAVEMVLLWLAIYKTVPYLMTFEGRNFDIISGLTAPLVYYFGYVAGKMHRSWVLIWNLMCIALLVNVVTIAILAVPTPFQQLAFDQPNIAVLHLPFIWLPAVLVPLVFFSHLVCIRQLFTVPMRKLSKPSLT